MRLPWIDYRSELRRPVSLVLLVLTLVGWIVVARLAWVLSERDHDYRRQVGLLTRRRRLPGQNSSSCDNQVDR